MILIHVMKSSLQKVYRAVPRREHELPEMRHPSTPVASATVRSTRPHTAVNRLQASSEPGTRRTRASGEVLRRARARLSATAQREARAVQHRRQTVEWLRRHWRQVEADAS